jgi:acyl carrier protein
MTSADTTDEVDRIIADVLRVDQDALGADTVFGEDVRAESLDYVEIAETIEFELEVEVPDDDLQEFETVGDVRRYVAEHR